MKYISLILCMVISFMLSSISPAVAGDKEDLEARIIKYHEVWNAKDGKAFVEYFSSAGTIFTGANGGLFSEPVFQSATGLSETEVQFNFTPRYIQVRIYGNGTVGAVNYYRMGSTTSAEGVTSPVSLRLMEVWIKERGQWRVTHRNISQFRVGGQDN